MGVGTWDAPRRMVQAFAYQMLLLLRRHCGVVSSPGTANTAHNHHVLQDLTCHMHRSTLVVERNSSPRSRVVAVQSIDHTIHHLD